MEKEDNEIQKRADDFLQIFRKGEEFTQDLLKENERLRFKILKLEDELRMPQRSAETYNSLTETLRQVREERNVLLDRFKEAEQENNGFAARYTEIEKENSNLANLYVASYQLHSTLDFKDVLRILVEIIINQVGSGRFAVMLFDKNAEELSVVASEGFEDLRFDRVKLDDGGIIAQVAKTGESYYEPDLENFMPDSDDPIACIPLKVGDRVIGAIAIYSLMEQKKKKLTPLDYELFSMLEGHAATAVFSSKLYSQSERKLSTIQGFIDLLSGRVRP